MPPRMIRVRNKTTGDVTTVSEHAFGYFAADFERLDQTPTAPAERPPQSVHAVPDEQPNSLKTTVRRTPAVTTEKEQ